MVAKAAGGGRAHGADRAGRGEPDIPATRDAPTGARVTGAAAHPPSDAPVAGIEPLGVAGSARSPLGTGDARVPVTRRVDLGLATLMPDLDAPDGWLLTLDGAPQSYVDLADPTHLEFEYIRRLAFVVDLMAPAGDPARVLHLGGGGLTLPRYVAATRPGSPQQVVEIDGALSALVRRLLPLPPGHGVDERTEDARAAVEAAPDGSADLLIADVFRGSHVPAPVASVEFVRHAARVVGPTGVYAANLADSGDLAFSRVQAANARAAFRHVCLLAEPSVLRGRRYGNVMLVGSARELPVADLVRRAAGDAFPARVCHGEALADLVGDAQPCGDADATGSPPPPRLS